MKPYPVIRLALAALLFATGLTSALAAPPEFDERVRFSRRNLSGPRLGVTYVVGDNALANNIKSKDMGRALSQFGWHFEYQVIPEGGGPQFVVQLTPLVAGVEYGKIIPGVTMAMGIRFPSGWEFGLGPNLIAGTETSATSLVIAVGKSINYGGVSIPLNLAYATNPDGTRVSFIIGYAVDRR